MSCPSVRPIILTVRLHGTTRRHWKDFHATSYLSISFENLWRIFMLQGNLTRMTGNLHEDVCTSMIISRWNLLRTRTVSDKSSRGNQNTYYIYEGKSLNNRDFILKCMEKYEQWKILFRDTKRLLSNMPFRSRDDRALWACAIARTTWSLHCQLAPWKGCAYSGYTTCSEIWDVDTSTVQSELGAVGLSLHVWKNICGTRSLHMTKR